MQALRCTSSCPCVPVCFLGQLSTLSRFCLPRSLLRLLLRTGHIIQHFSCLSHSPGARNPSSDGAPSAMSVGPSRLPLLSGLSSFQLPFDPNESPFRLETRPRSKGNARILCASRTLFPARRKIPPVRIVFCTSTAEAGPPSRDASSRASGSNPTLFPFDAPFVPFNHFE